jgi:hypothetical protein
VGFVGEACGDVKSVRVTCTCRGCVTLAEDNLPEGGKGEGLAGGVGELAEEGEGCGVVDVDKAVAEVADEEVAAEDTESGGGDGYSPGRVEVAAGDGARDEVAVEIEYVDDAVTGPYGLDVAGSRGAWSGG